MSDDEIYRAFGRSVAARRRELQMTQATLASQVGMSRASIANIESGRQNVLLHHVYRLASSLGIAKIIDLLPASPDFVRHDDIEVRRWDETDVVSAQDRMQINELIASAMGQRGASRTGS